MLTNPSFTTVDDTRTISHRTKGRNHGPVTRLFSPGDIGQVIKPFVFLDLFDMNVSDTSLFGYHPHSGIATITVVFQGDTQYEDSTGASGLLKAGGVEWMQAGGGVWHTANPADPGRVRGYQLWIALPPELENAPASSNYLAPEDVPQVGPARVILGEYGEVSSPLPQVSPMTYLHVRLKDGERWTYIPPSHHDVAWVAVDEGVLQVGSSEFSRELAVFSDGSGPVEFVARGTVNFVLGSAIRHPYPLVTGYYSVHTASEALQIGEAGIEAIAIKLKAEGKL